MLPGKWNLLWLGQGQSGNYVELNEITFGRYDNIGYHKGSTKIMNIEKSEAHPTGPNSFPPI